MPDARSLLARFTVELMENDPSFLIYSAQNHYGNFRPYIHQQLLLWRLSIPEKIRTIIGDEIGLGKTIEAILTIKILQKRGAKKFLLLLPKSLKRQWKSELRKFFPEIEIWELSSKNIPIICKPDIDGGIYYVSIDTAKTDENSIFIKRIEWDAVIVDEAHNLGSDSQRDELVKGLKTENFIFLSATPHRGNTKRYLNLLSRLDSRINPEDERFNSPEFFRKTHGSLIHRRTKKLINEIEGARIFPGCRVIAVVTEASEIEKQFGNEITDFLASVLRNREKDSPVGLLVALLRKRVSSSPRAAVITLERIIQPKKKGDVKETVAEKLVGESYEDVGEVLEKVGAEEVDEVYNTVFEKYKDHLSPGEILRLTEFLNIAREIEKEDSKLEALRDILNLHVGRGEKVIVFTEYKDTLDYLAERLGGEYRLVTVYGGLSEYELESRFEEFLESADILIATDVASEGLNLQKASVVVNYEPPWTPIKLEQRIGRVWRMGQERDVTIYNLFLGTRSDIELARILYGKMLNIRDALSDVKNTIGEVIQYATSRTIESVEDMIDTSSLPSSVKYRGKVRRVTEHHMIRAQLEGELDEFVGAIIEHIRRVRYELSSRRIYPIENPVTVRVICEKLGLVPRPENEKLITEAVSEVTGAAQQKPWLQLIKLKKMGESIPEYLVVVGEKNGVDYVAVAEVNLGRHELRIPFVFSDGSLLLGANALRYLLKIIKRAVPPDEVYTRETLEPSTYAVKSKLTEVLNSLILPYRDYGFNVEIRDVKINILCRILRLSEETLSSSRNYAVRVGFSAEEFAKEYESVRGYRVEPRQTLRSYDFYSFKEDECDLPEGKRKSERYIEVKGHGRGGELCSVSPEEFEFGREMGDKYWLYLVWNVLEGNPVLVAFRNPYNRDLFEIIRREEEIVIKREVYQLRFRTA